MSALRVPLSRGGPVVSPFCLGTASFGDRIDEYEAFALLDEFHAAGGNFIDTARIYADWLPGERGRGERIIGDWLTARGVRARMIVATKGAHPSLETMETPRSAEVEIRADLDASRRALRTDVVDLYWLHRDDPRRPAGYFIELLNTLVAEGKIRAFGASNWTPIRLREAHAYARERGLSDFAASQPHWCLGCQRARPSKLPGLVVFDSDAERFHAETGMAIVPYSSQAGGFYHRWASAGGRRTDAATGRYDTPEGAVAAQLVADFARELGVAPGAVVLAYLWSRPLIVVPVVGCRTVTQLRECQAAVTLRLDAARMRALEGASRSGLAVF